MRPSATNRTKGLKGFLIDLDYAQQHDREQSTCITGTAPFMALELLLEKHRCHTWRHDLESFFYVLIWLCTYDPYTTLDSWAHALWRRESAKSKCLDIMFLFPKVVAGFNSRFEPLKDLARQLRDILFFEASENHRNFIYTTPPGDDARTKTYNKVIQAFDDCIANHSQEESQLW